MSSFDYEALDQQGRHTSGVVAADSARLARQELRLQNLTPLKVAPTEVRSARVTRLELPIFRKRIGGRDLMLLTRQLATMLDAGAPLEGALQTLVQQSQTEDQRRIMSAVRGDVAEGHSFANALGRHGNSFSPFYRALINAGETSGSLSEVLSRLALHLEKSQAIRNKVITACIYPSALAVTALGVLAALITFVVPKVVEQFDSLGQDLPGLTQFVIGLSDLMRHQGLFIILFLVLLTLVGMRVARVPAIRTSLDRATLRLPVIGRLSRDLQAARLARTLSTLIACGAPVVDGLKAAGKTMRNTVLLDAVETVTKRVQEGIPLSTALQRTTMFPPMLVYMTAIGETSGRLDTMLAKAADHLEDEFETFTQAALSLLEPLIIIVMGGLVATIVLAILLPILRLNSLALM